MQQSMAAAHQAQEQQQRSMELAAQQQHQHHQSMAAAYRQSAGQQGVSQLPLQSAKAQDPRAGPAQLMRPHSSQNDVTGGVQAAGARISCQVSQLQSVCDLSTVSEGQLLIAVLVLAAHLIGKGAPSDHLAHS